MGKKQSIGDMQDRILKQFDKHKSSTAGSLSLEQQIEAAAKKKKETKNAPPKAAPIEKERISYYNPDNILNGFNAKSKGEQLKIKEQIKQNLKDSKLEDENEK